MIPPANNRHHHLKLATFLAPLVALLAFASASIAETPEEDSNRFRSPTAGFAITKPKSWHFASMEQIAKNRAVARLKDKELEQQIRERASAPLVAITKHPEPHDELNPSAQVMLRPLGTLEGKSAVELMRLIVPSLQRAMKDFKFVKEIGETKVGGLPAASMRATYTVANAEDTEFRTLARMWLVPRGAFMFLISMSGPPDGPDLSEEEFKAIFDSIEIEQ